MKTEGIIGTKWDHGSVAFIDLEDGLKLALWPRKSLVHDSELPLGQPSATEFALGHNVSSKDEVDAVMKETQVWSDHRQTGSGRFLSGYAGYFQDPDRRLWEIAWNPMWRHQP